MEQKLNEIFYVINDWLKFAEAKNAGLVVFNGGALFALLSNTKDISEMGFAVVVALVFFGLMNAISLVIAFWSILAKLQNDTNKEGEVSDDDNLLFFGHIAKYSDEQYYDAVAKKYDLTSKNTASEKDLANQVVKNSQIALRKFNLFNVGLWVTFCSLLGSPVIYGIAWVIGQYFSCN